MTTVEMLKAIPDIYTGERFLARLYSPVLDDAEGLRLSLTTTEVGITYKTGGVVEGHMLVFECEDFLAFDAFLKLLNARVYMSLYRYGAAGNELKQSHFTVQIVGVDENLRTDSSDQFQYIDNEGTEHWSSTVMGYLVAFKGEMISEEFFNSLVEALNHPHIEVNPEETTNDE